MQALNIQPQTDTKFYGTELAAQRFTELSILSGMTFMQTNMQTKTQQPNWVAAVFQNAAISLKIARRTTFAQLAEQLSGLAEIHGELMCPVQVRVAAPAYTSPIPRRQTSSPASSSPT
jgi:hypothetical protein